MTFPETDRLTLRQWQKKDRDPFAALCADPDVMRYFPTTLTRAEADAGVDRLSAVIDEVGYGFWAVEEKETRKFIGFVGLNRLDDGFDFAPCVEIGWRLQKDAWGKGFATEAATQCVNFAFHELALDEIISMTARINAPSENVMKKIGMQKESQGFNHPKVPVTSPLCPHVLYRLRRRDFLAARIANNGPIASL